MPAWGFTAYAVRTRSVARNKTLATLPGKVSQQQEASRALVSP